VAASNGAVQLDGIDGAGALTVASGTLNVVDAVKVGSFAQSAGEVDAASLSASSAFNQTGGKLAIKGNVDIFQASGFATLGNITAANLSVGGSGAKQAGVGALIVSDTVTLATASGDVTFGNKNNDFNKVVVTSAHDVILSDINALDVSGNVGGNLIVTANGAISQTSALDVAGSIIIEAGGLQLDDKKNNLRGRVKVTTGGDALLTTVGGLAIGGDVGGKLVLTAGGPVIQTAGDALHVKGSSSVIAGANAITFSEADNHFTGALAVTGSNVKLVDKGALALGASNVAGSLAITTAGALTQSGTLNVTGASTISAKGQAVTLADSANSFGGKLTLGAASADVAAAKPLVVEGDVDGALKLAAPALTINSGSALNLHVNTPGLATVTAGKALSIDGVADSLTVTAGGAVTQGAGPLTVKGNSKVTAIGQAITLNNIGNDFGGELTLDGAAVSIADKNELTLGVGNISAAFQVGAQGAVTQTGVLNVTGTTTLNTTGAVTLANAGNDFVGAVGGKASSFTLRDKNILTLSKLTAATADLGAGTQLQVDAGGMVDAPKISLSLSLPLAAAKTGAIGTTTNKFEVQPNAKVELGITTPAVAAYFGGAGSQVTVTNPTANRTYAGESVNLFLASGKAFNGTADDAKSGITSSIAQILLATQKKADSNAELIDRGLPTDLTVPIPYPHEGAMRTKAPD
jgi:hypothetical protein